MERSGADADRWKEWRRRKTCVWTWSFLLTETERLETFASQTFHFLLHLPMQDRWTVSWGNRCLFQSTTTMFVLICDMRVAVTLQKQQHRRFWVTAVSPGPFKTAFSSTVFKYTTFYDTGQGNTRLAIHCYYKSIQNHDVQLVAMKSVRTEMSERKNRKEKKTPAAVKN